MSNDRERSLALLERYYTAFNAADAEAMVTCLSDGIAHDVNQGDRELGKVAFRAFLARMERAYREQLTDIVLMVNHDGSRAAAEYTVHGEYLFAEEGLPPAHGQRYELASGAFFSIDNGLISRVSVYYNLPEWIAQVSNDPAP